MLRSFLEPAGPIEKQIPDWDDTFVSEAVWIDQELDRIESGKFLSIPESRTDGSENEVQTFSERIDSLDSDIKKLSRDLYGI